jgi:hypothetical protein
MGGPTRGNDFTALTSERDELKKELATLERQIEVAERAAVDRNVLAVAIEQAQRDRDALTSPVVEDLRESAENLCDEIERAWTSLSNTVGGCEAMAVNVPEVPLPPALPSALNAAATARAQLLERLNVADIDYLTLPELPPYSSVLTRSADGPR